MEKHPLHDKWTSLIMRERAKIADEALDLIEVSQWSGCSDEHDEMCHWCTAYPGKSGGHALTCKAALLLRKAGRKVRFQGDP